MDDAGVPALRDAILRLEGCAATWVESIAVHETHDGKTIWRGEVQVFDLRGHPRGARRAYAWTHVMAEAPPRVHVVLHLPPVDGPTMAVKTAILAEFIRANR